MKRVGSFWRRFASLQPSGSKPSLISLFSFRVLRCFGTATIEASTICPLLSTEPVCSHVAVGLLEEICLKPWPPKTAFAFGIFAVSQRTGYGSTAYSKPLLYHSGAQSSRHQAFGFKPFLFLPRCLTDSKTVAVSERLYTEPPPWKHVSTGGLLKCVGDRPGLQRKVVLTFSSGLFWTGLAQ